MLWGGVAHLRLEAQYCANLAQRVAVRAGAKGTDVCTPPLLDALPKAAAAVAVAVATAAAVAATSPVLATGQRRAADF